jgi:hypothetical protein
VRRLANHNAFPRMSPCRLLMSAALSALAIANSASMSHTTSESTLRRSRFSARLSWSEDCRPVVNIMSTPMVGITVERVTNDSRENHWRDSFFSLGSEVADGVWRTPRGGSLLSGQRGRYHPAERFNASQNASRDCYTDPGEVPAVTGFWRQLSSSIDAPR